MFRRAERREQNGIAIGVDRDQTALENYTVAVWLTTASTLFAYSLLARVLVRPAAAALAFVATALVLQAIQIWPLLLPARMRWRKNSDLNSWLTMFTVAVGAVYLAASDPSPIRYVAWSVLAVMLLNAAASVLIFAMRKQFDRCLDELTA